jgi:uncharacterized protein (DUF433 family)
LTRFFDTSALAKRYISEPGSLLVRSTVRANPISVARITYAELVASVARAWVRSPTSKSRRPPGAVVVVAEATDGSRKSAIHGCSYGLSRYPYCEARVTPFDRITSDPSRMNGQPCVRNSRLTVKRVLEALATYPDRGELLREHPELESEDIRQALAYAAAATGAGLVLFAPRGREASTPVAVTAGWIARVSSTLTCARSPTPSRRWSRSAARRRGAQEALGICPQEIRRGEARAGGASGIAPGRVS